MKRGAETRQIAIVVYLGLTVLDARARAYEILKMLPGAWSGWSGAHVYRRSHPA